MVMRTSGQRWFVMPSHRQDQRNLMSSGTQPHQDSSPSRIPLWRQTQGARTMDSTLRQRQSVKTLTSRQWLLRSGRTHQTSRSRKPLSPQDSRQSLALDSRLTRLTTSPRNSLQEEPTGTSMLQQARPSPSSTLDSSPMSLPSPMSFSMPSLP